MADPHSAVALQASQKYLSESNDNHFTTVLSTANPYKFSKDVLQSIKGKTEQVKSEDSLAKLYEETKVKIPLPPCNLNERPVLHPEVIEVAEMRDKIAEFISRD